MLKSVLTADHIYLFYSPFYCIILARNPTYHSWTADIYCEISIFNPFTTTSISTMWLFHQFADHTSELRTDETATWAGLILSYSLFFVSFESDYSKPSYWTWKTSKDDLGLSSWKGQSWFIFIIKHLHQKKCGKMGSKASLLVSCLGTAMVPCHYTTDDAKSMRYWPMG